MIKFYYQILFAIIITSILGSAQAQDKVYLGVTSAGQEASGRAGHTFLVISGTNQKTKNIAGSNVYQYSIEIPETQKFDLALLKELSSSKMLVSESPAWATINDYNARNRIVFLLELDLNQKQINAIREGIRQDIDKMNNGTLRKYNLFDSNCLTNIFDLINNQVDSSQKLDYSPLTDIFYKVNFFDDKSIESIGSSIPFIGIRKLIEHPLVKDVKVFRPMKVIHAEAGVKGLSSISELSSHCKVQQNLANVISIGFSNIKVRETDAYLNLLRRTYKDCLSHADGSADIFLKILSILTSHTNNMCFRESVDLFYNKIRFSKSAKNINQKLQFPINTNCSLSDGRL